MFPNTNNLRCSESIKGLVPVTKLIKTASIPINIERMTDTSFLYCDIKDHLTTNIIECKFNSQIEVKQENCEEFVEEYEYWCFGDDHTFLLNKEGDIIYYDNLTKNTLFMEKQHPSLFHPLQIHNIGQSFATCGGNVKNNQGENQKIIKVWKPFYEQELQMKCRIVTGHTKPIQNSFQIGGSKIVTLSTDHTIRSINLSTEQVQSVIPVSMSYYSGAAVDWSSIILGGIGQNIGVYDMRGRKVIKSRKLPFSVTQISSFMRVNSHDYLFTNINSIYQLDIRTMSASKLGEYEGERISSIKAISQGNLVIGNYDKSIQVWQFI